MNAIATRQKDLNAIAEDAATIENQRAKIRRLEGAILLAFEAASLSELNHWSYTEFYEHFRQIVAVDLTAETLAEVDSRYSPRLYAP